MPSLRRTFSSPAARSSPYYPTTNCSNMRQSSTVNAGGHPRRASSGSEVTQRRILGDIDWWTVHHISRHVVLDSQVPVAQVQNGEEENDVEQATTAIVPDEDDVSPFWHDLPQPGTGAGATGSETVGTFHLGVSLDEPVLSPLFHFAALSISSGHGHRRASDASSNSSFSSIENSPTSTEATLSSEIDLSSFADILPSSTRSRADAYAALGRASTRRPNAPPLGMARSFSYSYVESGQTDMFDDVLDVPSYFSTTTDFVVDEIDDEVFQ